MSRERDARRRQLAKVPPADLRPFDDALRRLLGPVGHLDHPLLEYARPTGPRSGSADG